MIAVRRAAEGVAAPSAWMTAQGVAAELGCHVETVYAMAKAGTLPGARRHGMRSWRFHREELEAYKRGRSLQGTQAAQQPHHAALAAGVPAATEPAHVATTLPPVPAVVTVGDIEKLGLLLLGYADLLRRQVPQPEKEGR